MTTPPVSIIMPCYNSVETLPAALDAIIALDYPVFELIVVDDCSTDSSYSIVQQYAEKYPFIYLFKLEHNSGVQAARDFTTRKARYEWIASTDSDAEVAPDWLKKACRHFAAADMIGGRFLAKPESLLERGLDALSAGKEMKLRRYMPHTVRLDPYGGGANLFYRKAVFTALGGYDPEVRAGEDILFIANGLEKGFVYCFDPDLVVVHPFSPRCSSITEFLCRFWQLHKWRKVAGKKSRLIRNRNYLIAAGGMAVYVTWGLAILLAGIVSGTLLFLMIVAALLTVQALRVTIRTGEQLPLCLLGALLKLVRRVVGGMAILLPGSPTPAGWSKRS